MRIRTLKDRLRKGHRFTAWLGPVRVTLSTPDSLAVFGGYEEQRKVASTAVEVPKSHPALKKELKWHWLPADDIQDNSKEPDHGTA